jgi:hypothetical protein
MAFSKALEDSIGEADFKQLAKLLDKPQIAAEINRLRGLYAVTELEWESVLDQLNASSNQDIRLLRARIEELVDLTALRVLLRANRGSSTQWDLASPVMLKEILEESKQVLRRIFAILLLAPSSEDIQVYASKIGSLAGGVLDDVLLEKVPTQPTHSWHEVFHKDVLAHLISPEQADAVDVSDHEVAGLHKLMADDSRAWLALENQILQANNCISATAYVLYEQFHPQEAHQFAEQKLAKGGAEQYWLLDELLNTNSSPTGGLSNLSNMNKFLCLAGAPLLHQVNLQKIAEIAQKSESKSYRHHDFLFKEGDAPKAAIFLVEGALQVEKANGNVLAKLPAGSLTGELGLLTGKPRTASLKVISPEALVIEIGGDDLNQLIERDSTVAASILRTVAGYI